MSYDYKTERKSLLIDENFRKIIEFRDYVVRVIRKSGAVRAAELLERTRMSDSWQMLAAIDYLVEIGTLNRVERGHRVAGQDEVYVQGPLFPAVDV